MAGLLFPKQIENKNYKWVNTSKECATPKPVKTIKICFIYKLARTKTNLMCPSKIRPLGISREKRASEKISRQNKTKIHVCLLLTTSPVTSIPGAVDKDIADTFLLNGNISSFLC